jgi:hypothetical protein
MIGWGGRIRTSTVLINSEVSYRLDHAPTRAGHTITNATRPKNAGASARKNSAAKMERNQNKARQKSEN